MSRQLSVSHNDRKPKRAGNAAVKKSSVDGRLQDQKSHKISNPEKSQKQCHGDRQAGAKDQQLQRRRLTPKRSLPSDVSYGPAGRASAQIENIAAPGFGLNGSVMGLDGDPGVDVKADQRTCTEAKAEKFMEGNITSTPRVTNVEDVVPVDSYACAPPSYIGISLFVHGYAAYHPLTADRYHKGLGQSLLTADRHHKGLDQSVLTTDRHHNGLDQSILKSETEDREREEL